MPATNPRRRCHFSRRLGNCRSESHKSSVGESREINSTNRSTTARRNRPLNSTRRLAPNQWGRLREARDRRRARSSLAGSSRRKFGCSASRDRYGNSPVWDESVSGTPRRPTESRCAESVPSERPLSQDGGRWNRFHEAPTSGRKRDEWHRPITNRSNSAASRTASRLQ